MDIDGQLELWDYFSSGTEAVKVNGALNVHSKGKILPFEVTLTTGDLTLIVAMIEDYIKGLDVVKADDFQWNAYYKGKFKAISEKIQSQINYDYEKAKAKCLKKHKDDDIGEEAMALTIKRAMEKAEKKEESEDDKC